MDPFSKMNEEGFLEFVSPDETESAEDISGESEIEELDEDQPTIFDLFGVVTEYPTEWAGGRKIGNIWEQKYGSHTLQISSIKFSKNFDTREEAEEWKES